MTFELYVKLPLQLTTDNILLKILWNLDTVKNRSNNCSYATKLSRRQMPNTVLH